MEGARISFIHFLIGHNDWDWARLKLGASCEIPTWMQGPKDSGLHPTFPCSLARAGSEVKQPAFQPVFILDANSADVAA